MKKQIKFILPVAFLVVPLLISCAKSTPDTNKVWVRIENKLLVTMDAANVGSIDYGTIQSGSKTSYKLIPEPIYNSGFCSFDSAGNNRYAGYPLRCGTPPLPPSLPNGRYTFVVEENGAFYKTLTLIKD